jgi:D-glycero-D-manno-heptose 1,7-bisphosphate phosphatase
VFLDRDGTISQSPPEGEYLSSPDAVRLLPGAAEAIRTLNERSTKAIVVTNQRGIALGKMSEADYAAVNERLLARLASEGAWLDAVFHCPHQVGACDCRKPATGMMEQAVREVPGAALEGAAIVGDSAIDVEAGRRLGLTTVRLGKSASDEPSADHEAPNLLEAVRWLAGLPSSRGG